MPIPEDNVATRRWYDADLRAPPSRPDAHHANIRRFIMAHTHETAPTRYVEANGIRFAYRRFGREGGVPILFNQHYTGTMD